MMTWVARRRFGLRSLPLRFGCWCELCTVEEAVGYFFISFVLFPLLSAACDILLFIVSFSGEFPLIPIIVFTIEVALDSSQESLSSYTSLGGCGWIVVEREVSTLFLCCVFQTLFYDYSEELSGNWYRCGSVFSFWTSTTSVFSHHCRDIIAIDFDLDTETIPTGIFDAIQHGQSAEGFVDFFIQETSYSSTSSSPIYSVSSSTSSRSTSSSDSSVHFSEDHTQIELPTAVFPSIDFTESTAQLRASIDQIQVEQVQPRERVEELKSGLSQKITKFDLAFAQSTSRQDMIYRDLFNDVQREVQIQKAALTQELTAFRLETQEGLSTLRAQLSEIVAYIIRGNDEKKGEESSSRLQPDDRSRPGGGGGGSRSEPPSKRGSGSYRGRGSRCSGFSRWFS
ncbi:myosin-4-like [Dorcoceras hygrometricum]|uniref:Myosin-4-like n=1 Tax=Dorcoceras hygrometricum TaxID=472368 RepID=A0A2Z7BDY5_9LAMI|nr:myosin-4-like [Dorcoceras hygrometricum]